VADTMPPHGRLMLTVLGGLAEFERVTRVASQEKTTLGLTFIAGLLASLWSANAGVKSLFEAPNLVYDEPEKRSFIRLNVISMTFTVLRFLFALVAMGRWLLSPWS
jgi:membrane protein